MYEPLISIVVCTYNRCNYLDETLKSLKRQTYSNYEVIVVNGPSTDDTNQIISKYEGIRVVKQKELNGLSFARNLGIVASKGEIVAFIDDDAEADSEWLKHIANGYSQGENVGGVGGLVYGHGKMYIQFDNGLINKSGIPNAIRNENTPLKDSELPIMMGTNCSFKKDVLYKVGGFDPYFKYYHDESELCARVVKAGYRIVYVKDAIVIHEMVEGHNRKSPYDLNWKEIVKNVIYFTLKDFGDETSSYTIRPISSLLYWILFFKNIFVEGKIGTKQFISICLKSFIGACKGYKDGLVFNIKKSNKHTSFLDLHIEEEIKENISSKTDHGSIEPIRTSTSLRIALLSQEYSKDCNGGICRYTYDLAHELANLGNEVHIISKSEKPFVYNFVDGDVFVHKINPENVDFLNLPSSMSISTKNISYSYAACLKLLDLIETRGIQIVEAPLWDAEGFVFSLVKNVPLVIRIETPLFKVAEIQNWNVNKDLRLANWMEGETVRRADRVIAISRGIGTLICDHHNVPENETVLCPLGIELPDENQLVVNQDNDILEVLFVGRLEKRKGIDTLFRAIPAVVEKIPNVRFSIVGGDTNTAALNGSYKNHLLKILNEKYHKNVHFVGFVSDDELKNHYRNCDLFVAPSLYESFGLIYLEAMAWGKPVIGCNVGGVPEVIADGETGIIVPPDNAESLAEAISKLLVDGEKRRTLGKLALARMKKEYAKEVMAKNSLNIYINLLQENKVSN